MPGTEKYSIEELERALENTESDAEAHKLYNNLGVAYAEKGDYRRALHCHIDEKRACRRLSKASPDHPQHLVDLAIAYRRCGETMYKVNKLVFGNGQVQNTRAAILAAAHEQHIKGLEIAQRAVKKDSNLPAARIEEQAACAALAHSCVNQGNEIHDRKIYISVISYGKKAVALASALGDVKGVTEKSRTHMVHSAAVNIAIAYNGLGYKKHAKELIETIAVRAKAAGDYLNHVRAIANLAEEASDTGDLDECLKYVNEWVRLAKKNRDETDEADALRKLGVVLFDLNRHKEARDAFQRALLLARDDVPRNEARKNLDLVEREIEETDAGRVKLAELAKSAKQLEESGNTLEEARTRLHAGELAFNIREYSDAITQLERYFTLVDNFNCEPDATGVNAAIHKTAFANLGESYWMLKKFDDAIHWATRELAAYGDDIAGQAQAWCNLGVYLDEVSKKVEACDALQRSAELAERAGDLEVKRRAQNNLDIIREALKNPSKTLEKDDNAIDDEALTEIADANSLRVPAISATIQTSRTPISDDEPEFPPALDIGDSVVIYSGHGENAEADNNNVSHSPRRPRAPLGGTTSHVSHFGGRLPSRSIGTPTSRSQHSRANSRAADGSSFAPSSRRYVDVASTYKRHCRGEPREGILEALRTSSAYVITHGDVVAADVDVPLNLSGFLLVDSDMTPIVRAISAFRDSSISLNLSHNPLLTAHGHSALYNAPGILPLHVLDLGCSGMDITALRGIANAVKAGAALSNVSELRLRANALGKVYLAAASAVAEILHDGPVQILDLSLNLLPCGFVDALCGRLENRHPAGQRGSCVRVLDMSLNNRQMPTALLQGEKFGVAKSLVKLAKLLPHIEKIDVRACGAAFETRKEIYKLTEEHGVRNLIALVSPGVFDEASAAT